MKLTNSGLINGANTAIANGAILSALTIVNDGVIRGTVEMGGAADAYAGLLGRVTGTVLGGRAMTHC